MNKIIFGLAIITFIGCGESKNQQMTKLINKQKEAQIKYDHAKEMYDQYDDLFNTPNQKTVADQMKLGDSTLKYHGEMLDSKKLLKNITFSIDSLSKMK